MPDLSSSEDDDRYNRVDGDEGWRQDVDSLEETLGTLGLEQRVARRREVTRSMMIYDDLDQSEASVQLT